MFDKLDCKFIARKVFRMEQKGKRSQGRERKIKEV